MCMLRAHSTMGTPNVFTMLVCRYTDGNLDEQLVDTMRQFCVRAIEVKGEMSLEAVTSLVRSKFTSEQNLSSGHMRQILQTLVYDGLVCPVLQNMHRVKLLCSQLHHK